MLNALDNLPEDPVELRRVTGLLASEVKAQALVIEKLQHQLHGANRHRFGSKSEGMDQLQLFAENEEIAEAAVKAAETAPAEPIELKEKPRRNSTFALSTRRQLTLNGLQSRLGPLTWC